MYTYGHELWTEMLHFHNISIFDKQNFHYLKKYRFEILEPNMEV